MRIVCGDTHPRAVCDECGYVAYKNPLVVVGMLAYTQAGPGARAPAAGHEFQRSEANNSMRILLARRNIEPRRGFWALPAGYMECGEGLAAGAAREMFEETDTKVTVGALLGVYTVPRISQVHMWFRGVIDETHVAETAHPEAKERFFGKGEESQEVRLFRPEEIPWHELAFPSGERALRFFLNGHQFDSAVDVADLQ